MITSRQSDDVSDSRKRSCSASSGFTLLEVMVAMAILAIALTTLLGNQSQSMFVAEASDFSFVSATLAGQKMAELSADSNGPTSSSGDFADAYPNYRWKAEVETPDFSETDSLRGSEEFLRRINLTIHTADERKSFTITSYVMIEGPR